MPSAVVESSIESCNRLFMVAVKRNNYNSRIVCVHFWYILKGLEETDEQMRHNER